MVPIFLGWFLLLPCLGICFKFTYCFKRFKNLLAIGVWIWVFLLWYFFTIILTLTSIYNQGANGISSPVDLAIAILYLVVSCVFPAATIFALCVHWLKVKNSILGELFNGIKVNKCCVCSMYNAIQCFWKIVWGVLIMSCQNTDHYGVAVICIIFHLPFTIAAIVCRPYERFMNNVIEIMIELLLLGTSIWLIIFIDASWYNNTEYLLAGHYIVLGWITLIHIFVLVDIFGTCFKR